MLTYTCNVVNEFWEKDVDLMKQKSHKIKNVLQSWDLLRKVSIIDNFWIKIFLID
jgi:hypothetical protein